MNMYRKALQYLSTHRQIPWAMLLLAAIIIAAALCVYEPKTVPVGTQENNSVYYSPNETSSQETTASSGTNSKNIKNYTVRLCDRTIGIFETGNNSPIYAISIRPEHLPQADRSLLEIGIRADSLDEAYRIIEDYE